MFFIFYVFWYFDILESCWLWGTARGANSLGAHPSNANRPIQSPRPTLSPMGLSDSRPLAQSGTVLTLWNPLKLFTLANSKPVCSVQPIPTGGDHREGSCPHFVLALCLLTNLVLPRGLQWLVTTPVSRVLWAKLLPLWLSFWICVSYHKLKQIPLTKVIYTHHAIQNKTASGNFE